MAVQKLYAGSKLREMRSRMALSQKAFAEKLGISLPYLNQMEHNHRPVSAGVVLRLAQEFGFDVTELTKGDTERLSRKKENGTTPLIGGSTNVCKMRNWVISVRFPTLYTQR